MMLHASRIGQMAAAIGGCAILGITGIAAAPAASASASENPLAINCNWHPSNNSGLGTGFSNTNYVYIHPGPSRTCGNSGFGYPGDEVYAHCWAYGQDINGIDIWIYLTDYSTGSEGWVNFYYVNNIPAAAC